MKAAFVLMIAIGVAIGLMLPGAKRTVAPTTRTALVATPQTAMPARNPEWKRETVLTREGNGHFYAAAAVNGVPTRFMVDTGASGVALTVADAQAAGIAVDRARFEAVGKGASGPAFGQRVQLRTLSLEGKQVTGQAAIVVDGLTVSLLGQGYLRTLDAVDIRGDTMVLR